MNANNEFEDLQAIVIAGGKCGSSTLRDTLNYNNIKSIKCHNKTCFKNQYGFDGIEKIIKTHSKRKKIYLIDSYRSPIERKISSYFETYCSNPKLTIKDLILDFNKNYLSVLERHEGSDIFMKMLNIKDEVSEFDFTKKYIIKEYGNIVLIKLRFNDIKEWNNILSEIFKKEIKLISSNETNKKEYGSTYNKFKEEYRVPKKNLNELVKEKRFITFNTDSEKRKYINYWSNKSI